MVLKRFVTVHVVFSCCFFLLTFFPPLWMAAGASEDVPAIRADDRISLSQSPRLDGMQTEFYESIRQVSDGGPKNCDGRQIDLAESIQLSLNVHPELKAWRFELEKAEDERKIARGNFGPSLTVSYNHSELNNIESKGPTDQDYLDQNVDSADLALVQPVFTGFAAVNQYKRSDLQRQWVDWKIKDIELQIVRNVQTEFFKLLQFREEVKSVQETVKRLENNLMATEAYYRVNMAPYVQVLQATVDLGDAAQRLSQAKASLRTQTVKLNVLLGLPPDALVVYEGRLDTGLYVTPWQIPNCLAHALSNRPDLLAAQLSKRMAETDVAIIKGKYYPSVQMEAHMIKRDTDYDKLGRISASSFYDRDQENQYWQVGLSMRWNFFESGKTYYSHRKFLNEVSKQQETIMMLENDIHTKIRTFYLALQES
jgi:outer membrane protein